MRRSRQLSAREFFLLKQSLKHAAANPTNSGARKLSPEEKFEIQAQGIVDDLENAYSAVAESAVANEAGSRQGGRAIEWRIR